MGPVLRVLELYCGIGGMHFALKRNGEPFEVVAAIEINPGVLETYTLNFPETPTCNRNIQSLSPVELNLLRVDMILMSPPCQPFCRSGLKKGTQDARSESFCHLMKILPEINFKYILLENVKGFEESEAHTQLIQCLESCGFHWQEFLITPTYVGIPNSRLRYYIIAKKVGMPWGFERTTEILTEIPYWKDEENDARPYWHIVQAEQILCTQRQLPDRDTTLKISSSTFSVGCVVDHAMSAEEIAMNTVPENTLSKYYQVVDIVNDQSTSSCCFTKNYGSFFKGTGSLFQDTIESDAAEHSSEYKAKAVLRFFSPREVSRLMCFPDSFKFPPWQSRKLQYRALGNSINVFVVSLLLSLLVSGSDPNLL